MVSLQFWTEPQLISWFASHPFLRNECLAITGGLWVAIQADLALLKKHQAGDPTAVFAWKVALRNYGIGVVLAGAPLLAAEILHILGAS